MQNLLPDKKTPNAVIVGNIAYDVTDFSRIQPSKRSVTSIGGACTFSAIPASFFYRVGIVGKIGNDFDISKFYGYNVDLSAVKRINVPTTRFYNIIYSTDGQKKFVQDTLAPEMEVGSQDIPKHFLQAKHFHLTTATPERQLEIIEYLRQNSTATISVDTIDKYAMQPKCREVFDKVDIAFIDKEYTQLLNCRAKTKVIKYGKKGCLYYTEGKSFPVYSQVIEDNAIVDKTGAGDCLNGVFINLLANGITEEKALETAVNVATESIKYNGILGLKLPNKMSERTIEE